MDVPPIVAVHPVDVTVRSLGMVIAIFPLFALLGKVYTVVNLTLRLQVALIESQPELSNAVFLKGFGLIVIVFEYEPIPISEVDVFVVTVKLPPTLLVFSLILIASWYTFEVEDKQLLTLQGFEIEIVVKYPPDVE
eukprot:CAMPEP_0168317990 /NCGR_PEP_ID=MMETSP0213-20121227/213_1 /TAXON_ID=151035 /ORGANISM="Euplotes harpa, Strain FSP1.4" /LENGTH=135 /DNA_ID=CAMNT_0008318973 /DNA_START=3208 /DNA_END=3615 /DNA_ORIENTATION=-